MTRKYSLLKVVLVVAGVYTLCTSLPETIERHSYWKMARKYCDEVGKPLLRIGMRRSPLEPPNGDITVDIDPAIQEVEGGLWADERNIPLADKQVGICFNEHTLEHLHNPQDVQDAVNECVRVADKAIFLAPSPYGIYSSLFCPTHYLRLWFDPVSNRIRVEENKYRTGLGFRVGDTGHRPPSIGQAMVSEGQAPQIVTFSNGFIVT